MILSPLYFVGYCHRQCMLAVLPAWNALPKVLKQKPTLNSFKNQLKKNLPKRHPYNILCSGRYGRWLTRLRLGLSPLNHHRYTYNLINQPYCPHCPNIKETSLHFFFECPQYTNSRATLLSLLSDTGLCIHDKSKLLKTLLFGDFDKALYCDVLKILFQYMKDTNRFC